ncbi:PREDICTED: putative HTLV-1-related endogenous sequence [Chinchilla lanigera]|uniref:putative HTLV-1-related endogenous sequence n=1 Tax=Chinchilla lanigera TaxID=34839 RepID=UPI0006976CBA|nr:PREDICTED: putative HTLV-1-related endogenous sequence [Chinchilla lanigera]
MPAGRTRAPASPGSRPPHRAAPRGNPRRRPDLSRACARRGAGGGRRWGPGAAGWGSTRPCGGGARESSPWRVPLLVHPEEPGSPAPRRREGALGRRWRRGWIAPAPPLSPPLPRAGTDGPTDGRTDRRAGGRGDLTASPGRARGLSRGPPAR